MLKPTAESDSDVFNGIDSMMGKYIMVNDFCQTVGWKNLDLGPNAVSDLQTLLASDWFAVGIMLDIESCEQEQDAEWYSWLESSSVSNTNQPELVVSYTLPPSCTDGIQNQDETYIDCGGTICPACANGQGCSGNSDCQSNNCQSGTCQAVTPPTSGRSPGFEPSLIAMAMAAMLAGLLFSRRQLRA
jgi:hypothetical protein